MPENANFGDWLAVAGVKAAYCRLLDTKDWDGWKALFTEDVVVDVTASGGTVMTGRDAMVALVRSSIETAKTAHQVHFPEITFDGDTAHAIWPMQDRLHWEDTGVTMTGYGHYHEDYVRRDGRWLIARQRLTRLIVEA
jgi:uncharacterized protein (TIGR02246 family)